MLEFYPSFFTFEMPCFSLPNFVRMTPFSSEEILCIQREACRLLDTHYWSVSAACGALAGIFNWLVVLIRNVFGD